jgi:hypothetical protein
VFTHIAAVRKAGVVTLYVGGASGQTDTANSTGAYSSTTHSAVIGAGNNAGGSPYNGHIDEFRLTKGVARYTGTFTAPSAAFEAACAGASVAYTDLTVELATGTAAAATALDMQASTGTAAAATELAMQASGESVAPTALTIGLATGIAAAPTTLTLGFATGSAPAATALTVSWPSGSASAATALTVTARGRPAHRPCWPC